MNHRQDQFHCYNCKGHSSHKAFCPGELPESTPQPLFCIPETCPKTIPTKRFSSPNSPLSPEELEQLKACIETINGLLSTFGNPRDPENLTGLRLHFRMLRGILLRIEVEHDDDKETVLGILEEAGRDFLLIKNIDHIIIVPYARICFIHSSPIDNVHQQHEPALLNIDPCLRTEIVLNFGQVVSQSPELVNIFFGIPLYLQLVTFFGYTIMVAVEGEEEKSEGVLVDSNPKFICLQVDEDVCQIDIDKISFIKI